MPLALRVLFLRISLLCVPHRPLVLKAFPYRDVVDRSPRSYRAGYYRPLRRPWRTSETNG